MQIKQSFGKYAATCRMKATQGFDGTAWQIVAEYAILVMRLFILLTVWRALARSGVDLGGFSEEALLTYTLLASAFHYQFNVVTTATSALWEGSILNRYTRPVPVLGTFMAETAGRWAPGLLLYTLPVLLAAPLLGVRALPARAVDGVLFLASLLLSISLGFAVDFLFAAFAMRLKNGCWLAMSVREAISSLLSGELIPLALLPFGLGTVLGLLPAGSLASAPLLFFLGRAQRWQLLLQGFWNIVLWALAVWYYRRSEEHMISFGG